MGSLRARLFVVWALSLAAAVAVGLLLLRLHGQSAAARQARAEVIAQQACERIADRYATYTTDWPGPPPGIATLDAPTRRDLAAVIALALGSDSGVRAGVWHAPEGVVASLPRAALLTSAEREAIDTISAAAVEAEASRSDTLTVAGQTELLRACPLEGPIQGLVAWTGVAWTQTAGLDPLRLALGVLFALVLGIAGWIAWLIADWNRKVLAVEAALARSDAPVLPAVPPTGEPSLDRIVAALNRAGTRLAEAHARADTMAARAALSERLAALGRVAAGVAHEIRNPLAAMRLRAENALHGDPARRGAALEAVLAQIARLDHLAAELLAMTQTREPTPETVELAPFLAELASDAGGAIETEARVASACFDPDLLRRALINLLDNARRHAGRGGQVRLTAERHGDALRFRIADSGPGIDPALRGALFEPFVSGRPDGTGLGLAIARELATAHGGTLRLACPGGEAPGQGAVFELEVPWRAS